MTPFRVTRSGSSLRRLRSSPSWPRIVLGGCGGGPGDAAASPVATTTVDLPTSYQFAPAAITVTAGATVTWTNHDNFTHNVQFDGCATRCRCRPARPSPARSMRPGTYPYVCSLHPQDMTGQRARQRADPVRRV